MGMAIMATLDVALTPFLCRGGVVASRNAARETVHLVAHVVCYFIAPRRGCGVCMGTWDTANQSHRVAWGPSGRDTNDRNVCPSKQSEPDKPE